MEVFELPAERIICIKVDEMPFMLIGISKKSVLISYEESGWKNWDQSANQDVRKAFYEIWDGIKSLPPDMKIEHYKQQWIFKQLTEISVSLRKHEKKQ